MKRSLINNLFNFSLILLLALSITLLGSESTKASEVNNTEIKKANIEIVNDSDMVLIEKKSDMESEAIKIEPSEVKVAPDDAIKDAKIINDEVKNEVKDEEKDDKEKDDINKPEENKLKENFDNFSNDLVEGSKPILDYITSDEDMLIKVCVGIIAVGLFAFAYILGYQKGQKSRYNLKR